jgi:hypothetical protein
MAFPAFFDTNVLYGATVNDLLLWLADAGAFGSAAPRPSSGSYEPAR